LQKLYIQKELFIRFSLDGFYFYSNPQPLLLVHFLKEVAQKYKIKSIYQKINPFLNFNFKKKEDILMPLLILISK